MPSQIIPLHFDQLHQFLSVALDLFPEYYVQSAYPRKSDPFVSLGWCKVMV